MERKGYKMNGLKELLLQEQNRLKKIYKKAVDNLSKRPEGALRIAYRKGNAQYYHILSDEKYAGTYISKSQVELISGLAQKRYEEKIIRLLTKRLNQLHNILKDYDDNEVENVYIQEGEKRNRLISPIEPTWEEKLKSWLEEPYQGKEFMEGTPLILTEKGERVRSKSEKLIADYLCKNGIHYKYEKPLYLKGFGTVYPDFTILSPRTGDEIYWEHEGKIDDPNYAKKAVKKIMTYEKNSLKQGERLILSFETQDTILNTQDLDRIVRLYFK